jgi:hypothetical protein
MQLKLKRAQRVDGAVSRKVLFALDARESRNEGHNFFP